MRKQIAAGVAILAALGTGVAVKSLQPQGAGASSHAEAPLISQDPTADTTDVYAFVSPDRPDTVTLIGDWLPKEDPANGPNFYRLSDTARYNIKVDNNGDAKADITYRFQFKTRYTNPNTFLYGYGPVKAIDKAPLNQIQTYTLTKEWTERGKAKRAVLAYDFPTSPANVGPRTTPDYPSLSSMAIFDIANGKKVFVGPKDYPFFVDLGAIFDLATIRKGLGTDGGGVDGLKGFNVHSIALQIPTKELVKPGGRPTIGVWATTERQRRTVRGGGKETGAGELVQVSRLGNPLINEVIIPVGKKDAWNSHGPADDAQYLDNYLNPELAAIVNTVYPSLPDARTTEREDLVLILGRGIPGVNQTNAEGLMDMLRLNMGIPPAEKADPMAAVAGDVAGFPNGRRLTDDVVDIEIRAVADGYGAFLADTFGLPNLEPNNRRRRLRTQRRALHEVVPVSRRGPRGLLRWGVPRAVQVTIRLPDLCGVGPVPSRPRPALDST